MALVNRIPSNCTDLWIGEEARIGKGIVSTTECPNDKKIYQMEPNSYDDSFGGNLTTISRNPITASRERKKGTPVNIEAQGGFNSDLTHKNMQELLQGFMFADTRHKTTAVGNIRVSDMDNEVPEVTRNPAGSNGTDYDPIVFSGAQPYNPTTAYVVGDIVTVNSTYYINVVGVTGTSPEAANHAGNQHWSQFVTTAPTATAYSDTGDYTTRGTVVSVVVNSVTRYFENWTTTLDGSGGTAITAANGPLGADSSDNWTEIILMSEGFDATVVTPAMYSTGYSVEHFTGASTYDPTGSYNPGDVVENSGKYYQVIVAISNDGAIDSLLSVGSVKEITKPVIDFTDFQVGDIIRVDGFDSNANNGYRVVRAVDVDTIQVDSTDSISMSNVSLAVESNSNSDVTIKRIGFQGSNDDIGFVQDGQELPYLRIRGSRDPNKWGVIPGEWVYVGGDGTANKFTDVEDVNGWARVYEISADKLGTGIQAYWKVTFDKTQNTVQTDNGTSKNIQLFFGSVLKNEQKKDKIVRRSYEVERQLGWKDDSLTVANVNAVTGTKADGTPYAGNDKLTNVNEQQVEYLKGSVMNELTLNFTEQEKIGVDIAFMSLDNEQRSQGPLNGTLQQNPGDKFVDTGLKVDISSDRRERAPGDEAYNTTHHFSRLKLSINERDANGNPKPNPDPLFAYATEFTVTVNNNVSRNNAISVFGSFDMTEGQFEVGGSLTAYFTDVAAVQAVREGADVSLDFGLVDDNKGIFVDMPLISVSTNGLNVPQNESVMIPLENEATSFRPGRQDSDNDNYTLLFCFFDYLPDLAEADVQV